MLIPRYPTTAKASVGLAGCILGLVLGCTPRGRSDLPLNVTLLPPATAMPTLGSHVVFGLDIHAGAEVQIQWSLDGVNLLGANSAILDLFPVARGNAGSYQARVSDGTTTLFTPPYILEPVDQFWVVRSLADSGPSTLREVLGKADGFPGLNGIQFEIATQATAWVITLASDLPPLVGNICILGPSPQPITLDGNGHRPFFVQSGTLILDQLRVINGLGKGGNSSGAGGGAAGMGGALFINNGSVFLRRMLFQGNKAVGGDSGLGGDGENGGGGGFGGDSPLTAGNGGGGGALGGIFGSGYLDPSTNGQQGGGLADGDGAGGGATRGGTALMAQGDWVPDLPGGSGLFGGGGGFSVGPIGGGGNGGDPGGGGGGAGGSFLFNLLSDPLATPTLFQGGSSSRGGTFGGDGGKGDGILNTGQGGGGAGLGGAIFFRDGSLNLFACSFVGNQALPGQGNPLSPALGKGGALFIYQHDLNSMVPTFNVRMLEAQSYSLNTCTNQPGDPDINTNYDNSNFYVAMTPWLGNAEKIRAAEIRTFRLIQQRLGWPR